MKLLLTVLVVSFWSISTAQALSPIPPRSQSDESSWRINAEVAGWITPRQDDVSAGGTAILGRSDGYFSNGLWLSFDAGLAWGSESAPSIGTRDAFVPANIGVVVGYLIRADSFDVRTGVRVGLPANIFWADSINYKKGAEQTSLAAMSARGWIEPSSWLMNVVPVGLDSLGVVRLSDSFELSLDLQLLGTIALNRRPANILMRSHTKATYKTKTWFAAAFGWSAIVSAVPLENSDNNQQGLSLEVISLFEKTEISLRGHLNLDGPFGIWSGEAKTSWGVVVGTAHRF